jgi:hypothetical protein
VEQSALALTVAVVVLAGCGGASGVSRPTVSAEGEWVANARGVVDQLRGDVQIAGQGVTSLPTATHALRDESELYAQLLAYTDFGGCLRMTASLGTAAARYRRAEATLRAACRHLERAAALFTRSTTRSSPRFLLAASREAEKASPLLNQARFELDTAQHS